ENLPSTTNPHLTRPKPRAPTKKTLDTNQNPDDAFSLRKRLQPPSSHRSDTGPLSAPSADLLAAEEGRSGTSPDASRLWEALPAQRNPSGISANGSTISRQESAATHSKYNHYPPRQPPTIHYDRPGIPVRGMQGDVYRQQQDGHVDYNDLHAPYAGTFQPMGSPYPQFRVPYPKMENSQVPPSALPPQGDSQGHGGYVNTVPTYGDTSGYYYRGQPDSQFRPMPVIRRSPYPEAVARPGPSAYTNPPADHANNVGEGRLHSEHAAPQPKSSSSE
ncbi:hypothetical protein HYDPIDRAFT_34029, partial [Hydnomerulius pinastri MD-312]